MEIEIKAEKGKRARAEALLADQNYWMGRMEEDILAGIPQGKQYGFEYRILLRNDTISAENLRST